ncbi:MAG: hypothetical protein DRN81_02290 [Thermoproteota archaeon]|nr:MAG: hypothetical protein DRN81_02290 [Candidatus Korarchaeota archaeon]
MLTAKVLNSSASINSYFKIGDLEVIPGEQIKLVLQLENKQHDLRYIVENLAGTVAVSIPNGDSSYLVKDMTAFTLDRSIWWVELSEAETADLYGGNITFQVDELGDGTVLTRGWLESAIVTVLTGGCS